MGCSQLVRALIVEQEVLVQAFERAEGGCIPGGGRCSGQGDEGGSKLCGRRISLCE